jgi:hypothetical protein
MTVTDDDKKLKADAALKYFISIPDGCIAFPGK